jgi:hypothetical protein
LEPEKVIIASLFRQEVRQAVGDLQKSYPEVEFIGFWGDVFVRASFNADDRQQRRRRMDLLQDPERRDDLYDDLFGDTDEAYERSQLAQLIREHRPDVIIDGINTATAISYQDVYSASKILRRDLDAFEAGLSRNDQGAFHELMTESVESLLISQYIPQLIRHVVMINRAMREVGTRLYLKIGTTGTGGMGLNIPYTHGEDSPSATLMSKTAIAFAHTGLLFLMARTHDGPIVKEVKPAALVGWVDTTLRTIRHKGQTAYMYSSMVEKLDRRIELERPGSEFVKGEKLKMVVADTGENGVFTKGEFETITNMGQMELITPEEISRAIVLEIEGINTGKDIIPALDSAIMGPTYRAGYLRRQAITDLNRLEAETNIPSVALGELGPPELSKLLWEAYLLKENFETLEAVLTEGAEDEDDPLNPTSLSARPPEYISESLDRYLQNNDRIRSLITSVGVPILCADGYTLLRGPFIRIPEVPERSYAEIGSGDIDSWADKGWVDLRPQNMARWQDRFRKMKRAGQQLRGKGSSAVDREAYFFDRIYIGEVVGWVFNNEMGGHRIK